MWVEKMGHTITAHDMFMRWKAKLGTDQLDSSLYYFLGDGVLLEIVSRNHVSARDVSFPGYDEPEKDDNDDSWRTDGEHP